MRHPGGTFFDVARIIQPTAVIFVLENVKNLKSHDKGNTFRIIMNALDELGYDVADSDAHGAKDPKIIDGKNFRPQHRERIVLVGFRRDLKLNDGFSLSGVSALYPSRRPTLRELLDAEVDSRYILSPKLWEYLYNYAKKHQAKGNGFGYGLVDSSIETVVCRTLSARYYRDGFEILLDRGWDFSIGEKHFNDPVNLARRPRRLTPRVNAPALWGSSNREKLLFAFQSLIRRPIASSGIRSSSTYLRPWPVCFGAVLRLPFRLGSRESLKRHHSHSSV